MSAAADDDLKHPGNSNMPGGDKEMESPDRKNTADTRTTPGDLREASYIVLFIAAVFVINAMETGSYRTPWPVALITLLAGLGLFVYSLRLKSAPKTKK